VWAIRSTPDAISQTYDGYSPIHHSVEHVVGGRNTMSVPCDATTRGKLLGTATVGLGPAIGGLAAVPTLGYALAATTQEARFAPVSLGPTSRFTAESGFNPTVAPYVEGPAQPLTPSGLAYVHNTGHTSRDWLAPDAMFLVFSNLCTHVGRPAQTTRGGFSCPCHGSQFNQQGAPHRGSGDPPPRPIPVGDSARRAVDHSAVERPDRRATCQLFPRQVTGTQPLRGQVPFVSADILYPPVTYKSGRPPTSRSSR
jgi:Rieske Fe-S protein